VKSEEAEIEAEVEVKNFGFQISDLPSVNSASLRFGFTFGELRFAPAQIVTSDFRHLTSDFRHPTSD